MNPVPEAVQELGERFQECAYILDRGLATAIHLARRLSRPLMVEGEAGVGKTEIAKVLARVMNVPLIRLQCYEGIDVNSAIYEWNYARQMLYLRAIETQGVGRDSLQELYGPEFLIKRPLLQAIDPDATSASVLLIDEIDRADEEFEAFLLEILSDYQITIPEIGTIKATHPPVVVLTSNRTRDIHDALKRRCVYHWVAYPSIEKEALIVRTRMPQAPRLLVESVCSAIARLREMDLQKAPGVAETLDWTAALLELQAERLDLQTAGDTLCVVVKMQEDMQRVSSELDDIISC